MRVVVYFANVPMEVGVDGALVRIDVPVACAVELVSKVCHHQRQIGMLCRGQLLHMLLSHNDGHVALIAQHEAKVILGPFEERICATVGVLFEPLSLHIRPTELAVQPFLIFLQKLDKS